MLLKYFYDDRLAQASYMVGCARTGQALVVDPMRDITPYLNMAEREGLRITHVTETHIHADFVSGARELAAATGARLFLSDEGNADWKYAYADQPNVTLVRDTDQFMVGNIRIEVMATPGHTPEHIAFVVTDTAGADRPMGIFTGDFLFVGDVGRPDLLEEAAGFVGTKEAGARQQFQSVRKAKALPDYLQVWPGHGAGSACGKALGAIPSTTLGYEKLFNPAFQTEDEDEFVAWLLDGQPEPPTYFAQMKKVNKLGPALLASLPVMAELTASQLDSALAEKALVVDLRAREAFAAGHVPGTVSIPSSSSNYSTYVGWFVDFNRPAYFIVDSLEGWDSLLSGLRAIGVDNVPGVFTAQALKGRFTATLPEISADGLAAKISAGDDLLIIDVRGASEHHEERIEGAMHIPLGHLPRHLATLPRETPMVLHCASGYRSQVGTSYLRAQGFTNVTNLADGHALWSQALPTLSGMAVEVA